MLMRSLTMCLLFAANLWAVGGPRYVETAPRPGAFALAENRSAAAIRVDKADWPGVQRAAHDLQADVNRVTGITPAWGTTAPNRVLIGTGGKSDPPDKL